MNHESTLWSSWSWTIHFENCCGIKHLAPQCNVWKSQGLMDILTDSQTRQTYIVAELLALAASTVSYIIWCNRRIRFVINLTLWRPLGHRWPTWIDLRTDPIFPFAGALRLACSRQTPCGSVACMHRFSHILRWPPERQYGLCPSGEQSRSSRRGYKRTYRSIPAVLKLLRASKGYTIASLIMLYNPPAR